ncbi:hypothetical protein JB92DRAFT_1666249 [Gautieria morchelliformis]|nr:hypothetical protein JB92DRAFT_1666249 [Gautieria morchelliformis]
MEHTALNPFVPKISLYRTAAAIFELHIHLSSTVYASDVQITPHGNYFTISGALTPRVPMDSAGRLGRLMWTDQPCGRFGRDVNINLSPGTEYVVLQQLEEGHGYVIRYTIRNSSSHAPGISHSHNLTTPTIMSYNAFNLQQTNLENHDATLYNTIPATHMQHKNANHHSPVSLNQTRAQTHNHPHYYRASTSPKVHTLHALGAIDLNRGGITPEACGVSPAAFTETSPHSKIISINGSHPRDRASIPPVYTRAAGDNIVGQRCRRSACR